MVRPKSPGDLILSINDSVVVVGYGVGAALPSFLSQECWSNGASFLSVGAGGPGEVEAGFGFGVREDIFVFAENSRRY